MYYEDAGKMSMKTVVTVLFVIFSAIPCTWGVFDGRNGGPRPGDQFPVTGDLLQCAGEEPGVALTIGVGVIPGEVFKPDTSRSAV